MDAIPARHMSEMIENNTAEYFLYLGRLNGSEVGNGPGVKYIFTGCGHNRILRARFDGAEAEETVGTIVSRLKALDISALWMLNAEASAPELPDVLRRNGFTYLKDWKSMAIDLSVVEIDGRIPEGLEIRKAVSAEDLAAWSEVLLASFDIGRDIRDAYGKYLTANGLRQCHYLGLLDGEPLLRRRSSREKNRPGSTG